jgi:hypothetical protein
MSPARLGVGDRPTKLDGVEISEVADGLVVYQDASERVHYLNHTAALVYDLCNGAHSELEIAQFISQAYGLDDSPIHEVRSCLEVLRREGVVS